MTATVERAGADELTSLADYLASVLRRLAPLPPLEVDLTQAYGDQRVANVLAEDVEAKFGWPGFDHAAVDGYAVAITDLDRDGVRLPVVGDITAASWRPIRLNRGTCMSVAVGSPLPAGADTVVPAELTDRGMATVQMHQTLPKRGFGIRRCGEEIPAGTPLATAGTPITPALVAALAATGITRVTVRCCPRVAVLATGDELVDITDPGRPSQPGQVVDVSSHALAAAVIEAGGQPYQVGICDDDPEALRALLDDQALRADLIVTSGGTGTGPGDMVRRLLVRRDGPRASPVSFTDLAVHPCRVLGFGTVGSEQVPVVCLPGDPGSALIGFELLARPVIQVLAGMEPVFRPSVRGHLREMVQSPPGLREFRPARVSQRRGGGYTVQPLPGGPDTLSGLAAGNALLVLGERVRSAPAGADVDALLLDRRW